MAETTDNVNTHILQYKIIPPIKSILKPEQHEFDCCFASFHALGLYNDDDLMCARHERGSKALDGDEILEAFDEWAPDYKHKFVTQNYYEFISPNGVNVILNINEFSRCRNL